jgi:hypothetical protein
MKILDLSAGNRAVWFDKNHRDAVYVDVRPEVSPTVIADARSLPAEVGTEYDLIVFDPPHKNNGATGNMTKNYGHHTHDEIRRIVGEVAREAHRVSRPDALMAFKWNDHSLRLDTVLSLMSSWWEPLFGHGVSSQQRSSMTSWVMLRRRTAAEPFALAAE